VASKAGELRRNLGATDHFEINAQGLLEIIHSQSEHDRFMTRDFGSGFQARPPFDLLQAGLSTHMGAPDLNSLRSRCGTSPPLNIRGECDRLRARGSKITVDDQDDLGAK
jgi:hypothetical protein